ncbi:hypothetical protein JTE90_004695 [Oedothorax gibbosus]|uniref:Uncharacterized protein n=1 Tax=Oedothorax gibbosus TaxID=931172 RepID=A0AAV6UA71_9ARAC|nr:hypothetical protein JTE90_004695 [Oedothorax gibbosus]
MVVGSNQCGGYPDGVKLASHSSWYILQDSSYSAHALRAISATPIDSCAQLKSPVSISILLVWNVPTSYCAPTETIK